MNKAASVVLSSAYFPPVGYFIALAHGDSVFLESQETFQKQSYRSRCRILSTNGVQTLTLPVLKEDKGLITSVKIDYVHPWVIQHERAIVSSYRSSAFFEYYQDDIFGVLNSGEETLFGMNLSLMRTIMNLIGLRKDVFLTESYVKDYGEGTLDLRSDIHPKKVMPAVIGEMKKEKPYYQVFSEKYGFVSDLSILDLLFNEGPNSISYIL